ncbi:hypothetical protein ACFVGN_40255 [Streptomyces sp. NPDC057757]|uniref:hypothetical protein n=1 Tax=Streptomyces sp. NPDC057757 TaxID=3346241 RepID=UPI003689C4FC
MSGPPTARPVRAGSPPPWLWLTLFLFLADAPALVAHTFGVGTGLGQLDTGERALFVTAMLSLVQLLPLFFLMAAVLAILAPRARCRFVERRHGLLPPEHPFFAPPRRATGVSGAAPAPYFPDQIAEFLREHAPGAQLRLSTQSGLSARVYPGSWRVTRVGVFAPFVHLWETDREAARAVLLHELGHLRRGEQHVAGLGSPFTALVRVWPYVLAGLVVVPVTLLFVTGYATASLTLAQVVLVLFGVPKVLLLVSAALWSAELAADRSAARSAGPESLVRALRRLEHGDRGGLARLYHPPVRLRIWFASHGESPVAGLLLTLAWPSALLVQLLLTMLGAVPAYVLLGATWDRATGEVLAMGHGALTGQPAWWATFAVALGWAVVAGVRASRAGRPSAPRSSLPYVAAVLFPAVVLLVGLLPVVSRPTGDLFADEGGTPGASTTPPRADGAPAACPSPSAPPAPKRPRRLPTFTTEKGPTTGGPAPTAAPLTFRTLAVTSAEPLTGTASQAQDFGDRLRRARWTLRGDGSLTADVTEIPTLRTTAADGTTRRFTGQRTRRTDVSATTTWLEARLVVEPGTPPRLDLIRAATQAMRAVVNCQEFTSTSSTAMRLSLTLDLQ